MTLVLMGEHIDPAELSQISDQGYTNLLLITTALGASVNVVLSIGKIIAGRVWHSQAVFADGIHSLSDLVSDIGKKYTQHSTSLAPFMMIFGIEALSR